MDHIFITVDGPLLYRCMLFVSGEVVRESLFPSDCFENAACNLQQKTKDNNNTYGRYTIVKHGKAWYVTVHTTC